MRLIALSSHALLLALGLCLFNGNTLRAQSTPQQQGTFQISGKIVDSSTGLPLPGALVEVQELKQGQASRNDGTFSLSVPPGSYHLSVMFIGYVTDTLAVTATSNSEHIIRLKQTDVRLGEVQVTGQNHEYLTKSSQSVAVLTPRELEKTRGQTLGESLEQIPGVTVLQTGPSISKPVVRGLHSDRVLVLNAGVPQEGQQWGGEHAPEIDPFSPAKIEVLKGAAGVAYGAGAIGGVISVEPRELPEDAGIGGQITLNGFSDNRQGAGSLQVEGAHDILPGFAWRLQGSYRKAGNASAPDYVIGNTGFTEFSGSWTAGYHRDGSGIEAMYSYFETELGIYKGSHIGSISDLERAISAGGPLTQYDFSYEINPPKQNISHELLSVKAHHRFTGLGNLQVQFGRQSNHRQEYDAYRFFNNIQQLPTRAAFDLTLTTYTVDVKLEHDPIGKFFGTMGVSAMRQGNVGAGSSFLIPNFRSYSGGVYAIESWTDGSLTLNAGSRFDYRWQKVYASPPRIALDDLLTFSNVSAALGGIYKFAETWSINANLGTAFRPPSVNELYSYGVHHGTAQFEIGDRNLKSERSYSVDLTLKHQGSRSKGEVSLYRNYMKNFIFLLPNPQPVLTLRGAFPSFSYEQANSVLLGVDASIDYNVTAVYQVGASISIVRGDNLETGEPLYQMPSDRLRIRNTVTLPSTSLLSEPYVELSAMLVRRQDRYPVDVDYIDPPPGYATIDCSVGTELMIGSQALRISVSVRNLLNQSYRDYLSRFRYYIDEPGRDIVVRAEMPFGSFTQ